ncbi:general amino-acid permease-like protein GAP1 [Mollisia scopiformis]|uniref:General amino-acid permease-like protein GAP1 n=1 Tax=Mollisia scopiformis TaxID=149040 RepID=A0A194XQN1_MOLSC|nr:general amino-acid permease-like protein GAP1 [Mollisia scopiformis]KUJ22364.1 general amino-acid permease-like protein GAP1 [Mollisia scopiformis]
MADQNNDLEKASVYSTTKSNTTTLPAYNTNHSGEFSSYAETTEFSGPFFHRVLESFQRAPGTLDPDGKLDTGHGRTFDPSLAAMATANTKMARRLKGRHLQMIAIGGSIGTGLFIGSGKALETGGPASLFISFSLMGVMLYCMVHALGEMAVLLPVAGSFSTYSTRFLDPSWGFAMGWNYAMQWLVVLPLEIIGASITIDFWDTNGRYNHAIFVTIFLVVIIGINLFGVKGYGEAEFFFSIVKITAIIGFIVLGVVLNCGGGPNEGYVGGKLWRNPGAFNNGFKGLCSVFVIAAFSFAGTELVGLAANEAQNPRKSLPSAIKQVFWRITLFYIVSLFIIGLNVPFTDPRLLRDGSADSTASPFVISIENAGIAILPSVFNAVILLAVLSVGNSAVFGSSRTLHALALQGQAPRCFGYVDKMGRPLVGIGVASFFGLIAYAADAGAQGTVLDWMLALSGLSSIFSWGSIALAHIRFRRAWTLQGHKLSELAFTSQPGILGSWFAFLFNCLILVTQFWVGAWPVGFEELGPKGQVNKFFKAFLAAPVVIAFYVCHKIYAKTSIVRCIDMDLRTGIRDLNLPELIAQEQHERATWPKWKKVYKVCC